MNKTLKRPDSGFTIIEVVLVLAIAALIMLMVFLALPALQRGQRDTQRKDDISRLQSAISNYTSTNRGAVPQHNTNAWNGNGTDPGFIGNYMTRDGDQFADPSGNDVYDIDILPDTLQPFSAAGDPSDVYKDVNEASKIYVHYGGSCDFTGQQITAGSASSRKIVLLKALEGGGYECREV